MSVLEQSILERHSIRKFLPLSVPRALVDQALALAQHAPSNSNIQPWRLVFVSGSARARLGRLYSGWPTTRRRTSPRYQRHSSITGLSLVRRFTARWVSL